MDEIFTVTDVYDHAAQIGQDIEMIVNVYGQEAIDEIMPKIVFVLEKLETFVKDHESNTETITNLRLEKETLVIHSKRDEAIRRQLEEVNSRS